MPGILYVVATPIGNLEDITLRALRVLREVALVAAEDTRRTNRLLQHYSISTPTTSLHEHNERTKTPVLLERLRAGQSVALVSDAGTPLVSDPGAQLVAAAHAADIRVEPIPGPSAAMAALSASGFGGDEFLFVGFPPPKSQARQRWLQRLAAENRVLVVYEAPHRIRDTLREMLSIFGNRPILVARELTKRYEQLVIRPISEILSTATVARGEHTLVIPPVLQEDTEQPRELLAPAIVSKFRHMTEGCGLHRREAIRRLAAEAQVPSRTIYQLLEDFKRSGE